MTPEVIEQLSRADLSHEDFHTALLSSTQSLVKMSRAKMATYYPEWDRQDCIYRGERWTDLDDYKAKSSGKPEKMVVPNTFAQVMTATSFLFLLFKQNERFYTLNPTGAEDYGNKREDCELLLQADVQYNNFDLLVYQTLLNGFRFGLGVTAVEWEVKKTRALVKQATPPVMLNGVELPQTPTASWQEFVKHEGNRVRAVSPYHFFPDTRHPIAKFQDGEFCAVEEEYSMAALYDLQAQGEVAGVEHIEALPREYARLRGGETRWNFKEDTKSYRSFRADNPSSVALVTKVHRWIVPAKFKFGPNDEPLGPEEFPILYHLWYANDNRLIRVEPAEEWHNEFPYCVGQFSPDTHRLINLGLADIISHLQDVISWLINSHITSVRRVIQNRCIIDPKFVDTTTLDGEGDIYLKKSMSVPLDRAVGQLRVTDVTAGHMADSDMLSRVMQVITGVSDNMQGQFSPGRRDATQSRNVAAGAASRLKMHGHLFWSGLFGRQGRLMLSNLRQSISLPAFTRVIGNAADVQDRYNAVVAAGNPEEIICSQDFFPFDSTLASEKGYLAQSLQELMSIILTADPMAAQRLTATINPARILEEVQQLRGSGPITRFQYTPAEQQQNAMLRQQQMMAQANTGA